MIDSDNSDIRRDNTGTLPNPQDGASRRAKATPYELIGGDAKLREMVERFYFLMDTEPALADIRKLHPPSLAGSIDKLYMFLSGWLGGPQLYAEKFGHPMLRARHLPFSIGTAERDQWMAGMSMAMEEVGIDPAVRESLEAAFFKTADWMRNRSEPGTTD
ncbi:MAG: group II truncated hemoglobin [Burkholderiales bacterium]